MSLLSFRQAGGGLTPRTLPRLAFLALVLAGALQVASAAWIPVKAVAAQVVGASRASLSCTWALM